MGIPTILVGTRPFQQLARLGSSALHATEPRMALLEHPIAGLADGEIRDRADRALPVLKELIAAEHAHGTADETVSEIALRLVEIDVADDSEAFMDYALANGLSDGLPAIPPTRERITRMLSVFRGDPQTVFGTMPPRNTPVTAEIVAICGVMAGCVPGHFPVLQACVKALGVRELNAQGILATTGSATLGVIVNGPIREQLDFNSGSNCLGPGNRSNATVGRALALITRILGGAIPGAGDMATMGQPAKYTFCFAENEAASPWEPLHVERNFAADASTVTLLGIAGTTEVVHAFGRTADEFLQMIAATMAAPSALEYGGGFIGGGQPLMLITPEWATIFAQSGLSKPDVKRELFERAVCPVDSLPASMVAEVERRHDKRFGKLGPVLRVARDAGDILIVVTGGVGVKQTYVPNWIGVSHAVTVAVEGT